MSEVQDFVSRLPTTSYDQDSMFSCDHLMRFWKGGDGVLVGRRTGSDYTPYYTLFEAIAGVHNDRPEHVKVTRRVDNRIRQDVECIVVADPGSAGKEESVQFEAGCNVLKYMTPLQSALDVVRARVQRRNILLSERLGNDLIDQLKSGSFETLPATLIHAIAWMEATVGMSDDDRKKAKEADELARNKMRFADQLRESAGSGPLPSREDIAEQRVSLWTSEYTGLLYEFRSNMGPATEDVIRKSAAYADRALSEFDQRFMNGEAK